MVDAVHVESGSEGIRVTVDEFTISANEIDAMPPAIDILCEQLLRKAYGVGRYDIVMAVHQSLVPADG